MRRLCCMLGLAGGFLLGGCAAVPENPYKTDLFEIKSTQSEFYKEGPAQAFGPDFMLAKGQQVRVIKHEFGFSQVRLADNTTGYVASDTLKAILPPPAPPKPKAAKLAKRGGGGRKPPSNVEPVAGDPLFDLSDVPAPPLPKP